MKKKKGFWSQFTLNNLWAPGRERGRKKIAKRMREQYGSVTTTPTIFCNNCIGGMVAHDMGFRFMSPMVNLFVEPKHYVALIKDISMLSKEITAPEDLSVYPDEGCPIGLIDNHPVFFKHYATLDEAREKWYDRLKRVNMDEAYFILIERDGCTYEDLEAFDALPYRNKVALVHKPYPEIKCAFPFKGFEKDSQIGDITKWRGICGRKWYDQFDWVSWFKEGIIKRK